MTPPEVVLDRWTKTQARERPQCSGYVGKLDIDRVEAPALRSLLHLLQEAMNQALLLENANASGGTLHPPFHFDYLEVTDGRKNAHAFQHGGYSFIVLTRPLVEMLWDASRLLSRSQVVLGLLGISGDVVRPEAVQALLFQFQFAFLTSHEYTHHVHRHCGDGTWDEFVQGEANGSLENQAQELDADGYALYLTLGNYLRGAARGPSLAQVGMQGLTRLQGDEFLLSGIFVALTELFCCMWPVSVAITRIRQLPHPPAPVRIEYAIRVAIMWCGQNASVPESWFGAERFRAVYLAATRAEAQGPIARSLRDGRVEPRDLRPISQPPAPTWRLSFTRRFSSE